MTTKRDTILQNKQLHALLSLRQSTSPGPVLLKSAEYIAIGCDLRDLAVLDSTVRAIIGVQDCIVLCIAEVSIAYMTDVDADALIKWTTSLSGGTPLQKLDSLT